MYIHVHMQFQAPNYLTKSILGCYMGKEWIVHVDIHMRVVIHVYYIHVEYT